MQTHSSPYLLTALALALGFVTSQALQSSPAIGFPMGAVSLGANPVDMAAGTATTSPTSVLTAGSAHDFVLTDVVLSMTSPTGAYDWSTCQARVQLKNGAGLVVGEFQLQTDSARYYSGDPGSPSSFIAHQFSSGIRLDASDSLTVERTGSCGAVSFTLSGYHSQI